MDSLEEKDILLHNTIINYGNSRTLEKIEKNCLFLKLYW